MLTRVWSRFLPKGDVWTHGGKEHRLLSRTVAGNQAQPIIFTLVLVGNHLVTVNQRRLTKFYTGGSAPRFSYTVLTEKYSFWVELPRVGHCRENLPRSMRMVTINRVFITG